MDNMDSEATIFAIELLMPEEFLRRDITKLGGIDIADDVAVGRLANRYRVPSSAMAIRLGQLLVSA